MSFLSLPLAAALTLAIELPILCSGFGFKGKLLLLAALANLGSNLLLNGARALLASFFPMPIYLDIPILIFGEIAVFLFEGWLYSLSTGDKKRGYCASFYANFFSLSFGSCLLLGIVSFF